MANKVTPGDLEAGVPSKTHEPLNGETARQMSHARDWKSRKYDTSRDLEFEEHKSLACTDTYVKITMFAFLVFKVLIFYVPLYMLQFPVIACSQLYVSLCPAPTERIERTRGFWVFTTICLVSQLPTFVLVVTSFLLDCGFYYMFSIPWCIFRCGIRKYFENQRKIAPYRGGPSILMHAPDVLVAIMGQTLRHGSFEVTHFVTSMWCVIPTLKYYVNCNPFIYDLDERFVQQISTSMQDMPVEEVKDMAKNIISRCVQSEGQEARLDAWNFVPHYPYPPPSRRWHLGMQTGGYSPPYFSLLVHTTHADAVHPDVKEAQFVLSNSVLEPVYRVMLWYNNPYHFFTGFVEASVSTGGESQPGKYAGAEHPMWLVTGHSPLLKARGSLTGVGMIDCFFDKWLPKFVDEVRLSVRGPEAMKELHEGVVSKDGVSRPEGKKKVKRCSRMQHHITGTCPVVRTRR